MNLFDKILQQSAIITQGNIEIKKRREIISKDDLMLIGARIRNARNQLGFSQIEFAKHLGINETTYHLIEKGEQNCSIGFLLLAYNACKINPTYIVLGVGSIFL